jgi:hypothetical protein
MHSRPREFGNILTDHVTGQPPQLWLGITLAAPLNFMITEHVEQNKSTALGFLSLTREIGMTLGPTLFAGFITRALEQFPQVALGNLHDIGISSTQIPSSEMARMQRIRSFGNINAHLRHIPNAGIRGALTKAVHEVSTTRFNRLYWAAFVVSTAALLFVLMAGLYRRRVSAPPATITATDG